ncbi:hypothetical protein AzCIB_0694 [Azoarcus sp. CIB]|nr:hypothetical protein AzCIB_0694 [Azoarcus sp. CIB]
MARIPRIALARNRPMHQMGDVHHRLQRDLRTVEGTAAGRGAGRQRLLAALLARLVALRLVRRAAGFDQQAVDSLFECAHVGFLCAPVARMSRGQGNRCTIDARPHSALNQWLAKRARIHLRRCRTRDNAFVELVTRPRRPCAAGHLLLCSRFSGVPRRAPDPPPR